MDFNLEDFSEDVIEKAMTGLGLTREGLATKAEVSPEAIGQVLEGGSDEEVLRKVATALGLDAGALVEMAGKKWAPKPRQVPGLSKFTTNFQGIMDVNAYLAWDSDTREAVAFDSGADPSSMIDYIRENNLKLAMILLTHTHADHIIDLDRLSNETQCERIFTPEQEPLEGAETFSQGKQFHAGGLSIETRLTCGHSAGGTTYVIEGLDRPVAITGDAIFAGSMGGPKISYRDCLETNRKNLFTLPDETVLCPGHGPLTTVAEEKAHNPFFPEFK